MADDTTQSTTTSGTPTDTTTTTPAETTTGTSTETTSGSTTTTETPAATTPTPITFTGTAPASAEVGVAYSFVPTLSGGSGAITVSAAANSLPNGITLDATTGALSGTPVAAGVATIPLTATDAAGQTAELTATFSIAPKLSFGTIGTKTVSVGGSAAFTAVASGGVGTITYTLGGDALPKGITFDATSASFAGSPQELKTSAVTLTATDTLGATDTTSFSIVVSDLLALTVDADPFYFTNRSVNIEPVATNGGANKTFTLIGQDIPSTLVCNPKTGVISGMVSTPSVYAAQVSVTDGISTKYQPLVLQFINPLTITSGSDVEVGAPFSRILTFAGGLGAKAITLSSGTMPDGISYDATQTQITISGTPVAVGAVDVVFTVTDSSGTYNMPVKIRINPALSVDVSAAPTTTVLNSAYTFTPVVTGGTSPVTVSYTGTLPKGVTFDATSGTFSGTPSLTGTYPVNVSATDANGIVVTKELDFNIINPISVIYPTVNGVESTAIDVVTPSCNGGVGKRTFAVASNSPNPLPAGLAVNSGTGVISGTPLMSGTVETWITVSDDTGSVTTSVQFHLVDALTITGTPALAVVGKQYSYTPEVHGGDSTKYSFKIIGDPLPNGLAINPTTGAITGTPTLSTAMSVVLIQVTDGTQTTVQQLFLSVITPVTAPQDQSWHAAFKKPGNYQVISYGGGNNLIYNLIAGSLPDGTSIDEESGVITGTPTEITSGVAFVKISGEINSVTVTLSWTIATAVSITGDAPNGNVGQAYSWRPTISGGFPTKSYTLTPISPLPDGLTFDPQSGTIKGVPTTVCTRQMEISVTDGSTSAAKLFMIAILGATGNSSSSSGVVNENAYVQAQCDQYIQTRSALSMTEAQYISAFKTMGSITDAIYAYPTTDALDILWGIHVKYKNSYFSESEFFRGCEGVSSAEISKIATLYTAFRACTSTPNLPYQFSYLDSQTGSSTISAYLQAKKAQQAAA